MSKQAKEWNARCNFINKEFPFGPLKQYFNEENRLHKENGFAYISPTRCISYIDGKKDGIDVDVYGSMTFWYRGVCIPREYFYEKDKLTVEKVFGHPNSEVRWAGLQIIGYEKIVQSKYVKLIHEQKNPERRLYAVKKVFEDLGNAVNFTVVEVLNGTPEPDGSIKKYYLVTPPNMKSCQEAVAWTFRKEPSKYHPTVET